MIFTFYQFMFTFYRMNDFPKVLDWNQGLVSNLFCVCQLSLQLVIWLVSWSFTVTGAKKPSVLVTKRWAHSQPLPTSPQRSPLQPLPNFILSLFSCVSNLVCTWFFCSHQILLIHIYIYKYRDTWSILPYVLLWKSRFKISLLIINSL